MIGPDTKDLKLPPCCVAALEEIGDKQSIKTWTGFLVDIAGPVIELFTMASNKTDPRSLLWFVPSWSDVNDEAKKTIPAAARVACRKVAELEWGNHQLYDKNEKLSQFWQAMVEYFEQSNKDLKSEHADQHAAPYG